MVGLTLVVGLVGCTKKNNDIKNNVDIIVSIENDALRNRLCCKEIYSVLELVVMSGFYELDEEGLASLLSTVAQNQGIEETLTIAVDKQNCSINVYVGETTGYRLQGKVPIDISEVVAENVMLKK